MNLIPQSSVYGFDTDLLRYKSFSGSTLRVLEALLASVTALSAETRLAFVHNFEIVGK